VQVAAEELGLLDEEGDDNIFVWGLGFGNLNGIELDP